MNKEEFYAKLAKVETDQATPEEKAAFAAADAERAAGTYDGVEFKDFVKQGRIALRLPPSLHKELKEQAAAEQNEPESVYRLHTWKICNKLEPETREINK